MLHKQNELKDKVGLASLYIFLGLLIYMPLHVLISNWLGSNFGILDFAKVAKDPLMIVGFFLAVVCSLDKLKGYILRYRLFSLVLSFYFLLTVFTAIIHHNNPAAEVLGVVYNLRFLCFFLYGFLIASMYKDVHKKSIKTVLMVGFVVALFGVFQVWLLPDDALSHVGYSKDSGTQEVFYMHDDIKATERAFSTLKDPNSLGSYLIIILFLALVFIYSDKKPGERWPGGLIIVIPLILAILLTYSRSAWLGTLLAALLTLATLSYKKGYINKYNIKKIIAGLLAVIILLTILFFGLGVQNSQLFRKVALHDQLNQGVNSNTKRIDSYRESLDTIAANPIGQGVGSAGPVSYKNQPNQPVISENYFLQISIEVGIVGLLLFLIISVYVALSIYKVADDGDLYALALLASFIAISIANLFNHIWTNEAVAYTWWGLAGLVLCNSQTTSKKIKKLTR